MESRFIVISGLPGSGKSTLAQELASAPGLKLLDKDAILKRLPREHSQPEAWPVTCWFRLEVI